LKLEKNTLSKYFLTGAMATYYNSKININISLVRKKNNNPIFSKSKEREINEQNCL
jgi:hypothetical protein